MLKNGTFHQDLGADFLVKRDKTRIVTKLATGRHGRRPASPTWAKARNRFAIARFAGGSGAGAVTGGENCGSGRRALS
jgi:hypothetical protein